MIGCDLIYSLINLLNTVLQLLPACRSFHARARMGAQSSPGRALGNLAPRERIGHSLLISRERLILTLSILPREGFSDPLPVETLPEAQRTQGIDSLTGVISPAK